jgi:hypothetical protein
VPLRFHFSWRASQFATIFAMYSHSGKSGQLSLFLELDGHATLQLEISGGA